MYSICFIIHDDGNLAEADLAFVLVDMDDLLFPFQLLRRMYEFLLLLGWLRGVVYLVVSDVVPRGRLVLRHGHEIVVQGPSDLLLIPEGGCDSHGRLLRPSRRMGSLPADLERVGLRQDLVRRRLRE